MKSTSGNHKYKTHIKPQLLSPFKSTKALTFMEKRVQKNCVYEIGKNSPWIK
jgi:hypothetical protein